MGTKLCAGQKYELLNNFNDQRISVESKSQINSFIRIIQNPTKIK